MRYETRLEELAALHDGWYNGDGLSIAPKAIEAAHLLLEALEGMEVFIFPTVEGHIQLELTRGDWDLDVECCGTSYAIQATAIYGDDSLEHDALTVESVVEFIETLEEK